MYGNGWGNAGSGGSSDSGAPQAPPQTHSSQPNPPCQASAGQSSGANSFFTNLATVQHEIEAPFVPVIVLSGLGAGIAGNIGVAVLGCAGTSGFLCAVSVPVGLSGAAALGYGAYKYAQTLPAYYRNWWQEANQPQPPSAACGPGGG